MGLRGELFSTRMTCDGRTYFFNIKENRLGDLFLTIVESKPTETGDFDRRSIVIFQDNAEEFVKALKKSLEAMDEAAPSVRAAKPPRVKRDAKLPRDDGRDEAHRMADDERPRHYIDTGKPRGHAGTDSAGAARHGRGGIPGRESATGHGNPAGREASIRRGMNTATGRSSRPTEPARPAAKGKTYRVSPKTAAESAEKRKQAAAAKTVGRRMTVRKVAAKAPKDTSPADDA